jgi:hypothetical protein
MAFELRVVSRKLSIERNRDANRSFCRVLGSTSVSTRRKPRANRERSIAGRVLLFFGPMNVQIAVVRAI